MGIIRAVVFAVAIVLLPGCGREKIEGRYRDADNAAITYQLRADGTWTAVMSVKVPAGVFPHGSARKLQGTFTRQGDRLALECKSVEREDPITGDFRPERGEAAAYDHLLRIENGRLLPAARQDGQSPLFASDLNPLGARELLPQGD